jgi:hypothetical protein
VNALERLVRGFGGLCDYIRHLERLARVDRNHRREWLARCTDGLELLAAGDSDDAMRRVRVSLELFGGIGGSSSEAGDGMADEMGIADVVECLGIGARSVHNARERGRLEARREGRVWRFDRASVDAYKESRER